MLRCFYWRVEVNLTNALPSNIKHDETQQITSKMKPNKNGEQGAVADHHGAFSQELSDNYNLNTFVHHRSLRGVGYARTFC
jgi:hypothetical protein